MVLLYNIVRLCGSVKHIKAIMMTGRYGDVLYTCSFWQAAPILLH